MAGSSEPNTSGCSKATKAAAEGENCRAELLPLLLLLLNEGRRNLLRSFADAFVSRLWKLVALGDGLPASVEGAAVVLVLVVVVEP